VCSKVSVPAAETWLAALGRERLRRESDRQHSDRRRAGLRSGVSCGTVFLDGIAVELTEQGIAIFVGPIGQVCDKILDLFARCFPKRFHAAEISGIKFDQIRIELMLADDLAESVAHSAATPVTVCRLRAKLFRIRR